MSRTQIVEVEMPDGTIVAAEVLVTDTIADVGVADHLRLGEAGKSIEAFVNWAVSAVGIAKPDDVERSEPAPEGMVLRRFGLEFGVKLAVRSGALTSVIAQAGGEATAVIRLEWEKATTKG